MSSPLVTKARQSSPASSATIIDDVKSQVAVPQEIENNALSIPTEVDRRIDGSIQANSDPGIPISLACLGHGPCWIDLYIK